MNNPEKLGKKVGVIVGIVLLVGVGALFLAGVVKLITLMF